MKKDSVGGWSPEIRGQLKRVYGKLFKKVEPEMPKTKVHFTLRDGKLPDMDPAGSQTLRLRAPFGMNIPAGAERPIDLGLSCDHDLLVIQVQANGMTLAEQSRRVFEAGEQLVLVVRNTGKTTCLIEPGDTLGKATILSNSGVSLV